MEAVSLVSKLGNGFLGRQQPEALLARDALLGEFIVGAESRGVRGLGGAAVGRGFLGSTRAARTRGGSVSRGVTFREGFFLQSAGLSGSLRPGRVGERARTFKVYTRIPFSSR